MVSLITFTDMHQGYTQSVAYAYQENYPDWQADYIFMYMLDIYSFHTPDYN